MSFMKKDVNLGLLIIIVLLAVTIAALGIYYNQNYTSLSTKYNEQLSNLQQVTSDLFLHKSRLNKTAQDLRVQEEDSTDLNQKYTEIRDEKDRLDKANTNLQTELSTTKSALLTATNDLLSTQSRVTELEKDNQKLKDRNEILDVKIDSLEEKMDNICAGDTSYC